MSALPRDARSLFAAAREDGPDAHERDVVFRRVAVATGIAAGAAVAATAVSAVPAAVTVAKVAETAAGASAGVGATASAFSMKLIAIGVLIGAVSTTLCGLLVVSFVLPETPPTSRASGATTRNGGEASEAREERATSPRTRVVASGARLAAPDVRLRDPADGNAKAAATAEANAKAEAKAEPKAEAPSDLAEEARLVTAARTALVAGDAARALSLVQATRKLGARALEPEELGLEARALRALGRADDAAATELVLRRRYPESALAR